MFVRFEIFPCITYEQHNDANVVCIPARFISIQEAISIVDIFISTDFEGGRHARRVDKMACT